MVTDGNDHGDHPFGGFRVRTEPMADGRRQIHYYEWPEARAEESAADAAAPEPERDRPEPDDE